MQLTKNDLISGQLPPDGAALQDLDITWGASTIVGSGSITTGIVASQGMTKIAASATLSGNGSIQVKRYLDEGGTIPQVAVAATTIAGGAAGIHNVGGDGFPFASFEVVLVDTSGSTNTVTKPAILVSSK